MDSNKSHSDFSITYLEVGKVTTKTKTIRYTDEELDHEETVSVEVPLRNPKLRVTINIDFIIPDRQPGAYYMDNEGHRYVSITETRLHGQFECDQFKMPKLFVRISKPNKEGQ